MNLTRVRFETRQIAPDGVPGFVYIASALTHSTIIYTALVECSDESVAISRVKTQWPDSTIHAVETGVDSFLKSDVCLVRDVRGTYRHPKPQQPAVVVQWFKAIFGAGARSILSPRFDYIPGESPR